MKKSRILMAVGPILVLIGIGLVFAAMMPAEYTDEFTIPSGDYYYYFQSSTILGLRIEGDFEVGLGQGTVVLYIMTADQYEAYSTVGTTVAERTVSGASGSFDVSFDTTQGYLVFEHGSTISAQEITLSYTLHGTGLTGLVGGIILAVVGVVLVVFGIRMGKKEAEAAPPMQQPPADVMMFDQQKPPGNP